MNKKNAIKKAEEAGFTIRYHEDKTEIRFRKPGSHLNAMNQPDVYMSVYRLSGRWFIQEKRSDNIL